MSVSRRAKIVCTLGPATSSPERIRADQRGDGCREAQLQPRQPRRPPGVVRRVGPGAAGRPVGVLADLQGPKIRLGGFADGPPSRRGRRVRHHHRGRPRHRSGVAHLPRTADEVKPGDRLLIDDGRVQLEVSGVTGDPVTRPPRAARSPTTRASSCRTSRSAFPPCPRRTRRICAAPWHRGRHDRAVVRPRPDDIKLVHEIMAEAGGSGCR